ncbi:hypothetical protein AGR7A_Cc210267 [Agrobacterium deltaense NCPPB 1641]|uniref:Uncharacterized protein n=1 Tax=Agrobacterium deltaense NCPPB 1641 TaxID=1183425 RepID=A0A1S7TM79_9HYPH|nr:hypothetical protein AGR7A_Cc210267 [Agrobacterium deltaense NCPPB 1641]
MRRRWNGRRAWEEDASAIGQNSFLCTVFARTARTVFAVAEATFARCAGATIFTRATVRTVAIAARTVVTVALLHHRGRAFFVGFDGDGHVAKNVFVDAHLALDFMDGGRRSVDVHESVVSLAVLLDAVGEGLQTPVLDASDFAAERFDNALVLLDKCVDLLGRNILPGKEDVFVKSHLSFAFLAFRPSPGNGAKPQRLLLGKAVRP